MNVHIEELTTKDELLAAYPLIKYLRPNLDEQLYIEYLHEMLPMGYRVFGLYEDDKLVSTVLVIKRIDWYYGKYVWMYGLATAADKRSRGYGKMLTDFVKNWAREQNFDWVGVASDMDRAGAHKFYEEKANFKRTHLVFGEKIN